jgi:hypothetical protein
VASRVGNVLGDVWVMCCVRRLMRCEHPRRFYKHCARAASRQFALTKCDSA